MNATTPTMAMMIAVYGSMTTAAVDVDIKSCGRGAADRPRQESVFECDQSHNEKAAGASAAEE
jgi:hypothetical protein